VSKLPLVFNDPKHWHQRAIEARQIVDRMTDPFARKRMLGVAEQYEKIAQRAVERLKANARGASPLIQED
jgi:hypothetical protein